jgi:hypothetical protein
MSSDPGPVVDPRAAEVERRRRRALIFGDVLPESTSDDREPESDRRGGENDAELRRNVPPHHG